LIIIWLGGSKTAWTTLPESGSTIPDAARDNNLKTRKVPTAQIQAPEYWSREDNPATIIKMQAAKGLTARAQTRPVPCPDGPLFTIITSRVARLFSATPEPNLFREITCSISL